MIQPCYRRVIFLLPLLALAACAKEKPSAQLSTTSQGSNGYYEEIDNPETDIVRALDRSPLTCEWGSTCPAGTDSIGMIAASVGEDSEGKHKLGQCTGFLVAENIVATNAHCISDQVLAASECSKYLAIKFIHGDSKGRKTYACKKILHRSGGGDARAENADYAYFRIAAPEREPLRIDNRGIPDSTDLRLVTVSPIAPGALGGDIQERSCQTAINSLLNLNYRDPFSVSALAHGCKSEHGNSGSPVFSQKSGAVIGILQSEKISAYSGLINSQMNTLGIKFPSKLPPHFIFTNFSCAKDPESLTNPNISSCAAAENVKVLGYLDDKKIMEALAPEIQKRVGEWQMRLPRAALYRIGVSKNDTSVLAQPRCLLPLDQWPAEILRTETQEGYWPWQQQIFEVTYENSYRFSMKARLDGRLRVDTSMDITDSVVPAKFTFTVKKEGQPVKALLQIGSISLPYPDLKWCSPQEISVGNIEEASISQ
jgi:hypothetical protein